MTPSIKNAEPFLLRVPLGVTIADSFNVADEVELPGIRLTLEDGTLGYGHTMTLGVGGDAILAHLRVLAPILEGHSPFETRALWERMFWSDVHWVGRAGAAAMALSAADIALWDAQAKLIGEPLWQVLGGGEKQSLPCYNTHVGWLNIDADQLVANAVAVADEKLTGIKIKLGRPDWREDLDRVSKVRSAVGDTLRIMTDVNQRWDLNTAITAGRHLADYDIVWLEEPLDPDDVLAHQKLVSAIATPIALGEHLYSVRAFRDYIYHDAARLVQPDVTRVGGVSGFLRVADLAAAFNVPVCAHAGDLMQVHQHLSFALPNIGFLEYLPWCTSIWEEPLQLVDGRVARPEAPGASTTVTRNALEKYRVA